MNASKPKVTVIYGYNYNANPDYSAGESCPASNFYLQGRTYSNEVELYPENQNTVLHFGYPPQVIERFEKTVIFSTEAKALVDKLWQDYSYMKLGHNNPLEYVLYKLGVMTDTRQLFDVEVIIPE